MLGITFSKYLKYSTLPSSYKNEIVNDINKYTTLFKYKLNTKYLHNINRIFQTTFIFIVHIFATSLGLNGLNYIFTQLVNYLLKIVCVNENRSCHTRIHHFMKMYVFLMFPNILLVYTFTLSIHN